MTPNRDRADAIPRIPAAAAAMIRDGRGRLLIVKPTYKKGWTLPGGQLDPGESPWDACRREAREECGLELSRGRLACVDFLPARTEKLGGVRFLFDCGVLPDGELAVVVDGVEISEHRFVDLEAALELLRTAVRRRVAAASGSERFLYLEDGRPVDGVG